MEVKIDETYHVARFCCPQYVHIVFGKSSLHHLSFILKWKGRRLTAKAKSSGYLVANTMSPRAGKGAPDCSKTKLTVRLHPREYFRGVHALLALRKEWTRSVSLCQVDLAAKGVEGVLMWNDMHGTNVLPERTSDKGTIRYYYIAYPFCSEFYPLLEPIHRNK